MAGALAFLRRPVEGGGGGNGSVPADSTFVRFVRLRDVAGVGAGCSGLGSRAGALRLREVEAGVEGGG